MSSKKQTFLHGAALLTLATAVVKVIGALYKIPLNAIIGEKGFGYFNTADYIYSVLLLISTAGPAPWATPIRSGGCTSPPKSSTCLWAASAVS